MIPVRKADIVFGRPLPWPVFDRDRHLLLRAGFTVQSESQLEELGRRGLYRTVGNGAEGHKHDVLDDVEVRGETWRSWKFDQLKLPLYTRLSIQKLDPDDDGRFAASLLGVFRDVSIIVGIPAPGGQLAMFRQGQPLLLRAFSGTSVFAFTASVLTVRYVPAAYLHLEYPRTVDGTEVRSRKRINVKLIAVARRKGGAGTEPADGVPTSVADLSVGGTRLLARAELGPPGTELEVAFRLKTPLGEATLDLNAVVRSVAPGDDGTGIAHGVQFVGLKPIEHLALEGFVTHVSNAQADA
jgi:hypothetical protein